MTDIDCITTLENWLYLYVVIDFCWRRMVGNSAESRMATDFDLQALLLTVSRRRTHNLVTLRYNQGCEFVSGQWQILSEELEPSMRGRGNRYDNAVGADFLQLLMRQCVRRRKYSKREAAIQGIHECSELF